MTMAQRKRTIRLYRINEDGRRLLAATIKVGSPAELAALWRAFLATAARGTYIAHYRGETLGLEAVGEAGFSALAA
jgi:hypothetical protein